MHAYRAPRWLAGHGPVGGNVQTIWPALWSHVHPHRRVGQVDYIRERWDTPDGDFIDLDFFPAAAQAHAGQAAVPMLVLFHGLEGSSQSHYSRAFALWAHAMGWGFVVPHFRGCSGELNRGPRTYFSGDHQEIDWILRRLAMGRSGPLVAVGISLGGNMLLRWAQEAGAEASRVVKAVAAVSSPVDLTAVSESINRGFNKRLYTRMFLASLKPKALAKLEQFPHLADADAIRRSDDFLAYDDAFTAPIHGFAGARDYWQRCSAKPHLRHMRDVPALVLNARNDPFIPAWCLPLPAEVGPAVTLWQPHEGGHVGFPSGRFPGHVADLPQAVGAWLRQHI
jgi:predicted alpha/beta-fold hydrolase